MPRVIFAPHLQRHVPCPDQDVAGATVGEALDVAFAAAPRLRGYVLDEQDRARKHVAIFVAGARVGLDHRVGPHDEIFIFQALSGG